MTKNACDHPVDDTISNAAIKCYCLFFQIRMHLTSLHIMVKGDQIIIFSAGKLALGMHWGQLKKSP